MRTKMKSILRLCIGLMLILLPFCFASCEEEELVFVGKSDASQEKSSSRTAEPNFLSNFFSPHLGLRLRVLTFVASTERHHANIHLLHHLRRRRDGIGNHCRTAHHAALSYAQRGAEGATGTAGTAVCPRTGTAGAAAHSRAGTAEAAATTANAASTAVPILTKVLSTSVQKLRLQVRLHSSQHSPCCFSVLGFSLFSVIVVWFNG